MTSYPVTAKRHIPSYNKRMEKKFLVLVSVLFLFSLLLRLYFIHTFPFYNDESTYIRDGLLMVTKPDLRFLSLDHWGKYPLPFWIFGSFAAIFFNPYAARYSSFIAFCITCLILFLALRQNTVDLRTRLGILLLYAFSPFSMIFQSLVLMEAMLLPLSLLVLYILRLYEKKPNFLLIMSTFLLSTIAVLIKVTALPLFFLFPTLLLIHRHFPNKSVFHFFVYLILSGTLAYSMRGIIPDLWGQTMIHITSFSDITQLPVSLWIHNTLLLLYGSLIYLFPLFLVLFNNRNNKTHMSFFIVSLLLLIFPSLLLGKPLYYRYFSQGIILIFVILAKIYSPLSKKILIGSVSVSMILSVWFVLSPQQFFTLFPAGSALASERDYAFGRPSGYPARDIVHSIEKTYPYSSVVIATPDDPGNPSDYFHAIWYFHPNRKVVLTSTSDDIKALKQYTDSFPILFIARNTLVTEEMKTLLSPPKTFYPPDETEPVNVYEL